jgi:hypothetical protein
MGKFMKFEFLKFWTSEYFQKCFNICYIKQINFAIFLINSLNVWHFKFI